MKKTCITLLTMLMVMFFKASCLFAQDVFQAKSIRCRLGEGTQCIIAKEKKTIKKVNFGDSGTVVFDFIDPNKGTARLIGSQGAGDVNVLLTGVGLTFIEITEFGGVNITTVFRDGSGNTDTIHVVQSRHLAMPGALLPSQYYGYAEVLE